MKYWGLNFGMYSVGKEYAKIRVKPAVIDRIMEIMAVISLLSGWSMAFCLVPASDWRDLYISLAVSLLLFALLLFSAYAPAGKINYPVRITKYNMVFQYLIAVRLVRFVNIILSPLLPLMHFSYDWAAILRFTLIVILFCGIIVYYAFAIKNR